MSQNSNTQRPMNQGGPMGRGGWGAMGRPVEKAKDFWGSLRRLLRLLPAAKGPPVNRACGGHLRDGVQHRWPENPGSGDDQALQWPDREIRGGGKNQAISKALAQNPALPLHPSPVPGIDFGYIGNVLLILLGLYVISAIFMYIQQYLMAGVAQRTVYRLRKEVDEKLSRLPLKYFDGRTHGEILSRAVNDMDNISTTLQQSVTQLITSVVTLIGVLVMMLTISWLLSLIVLVTLPLSLFIVTGIAKRSQNYFRKQQRSLGRSQRPCRRDVYRP